MGNKDNPYSIRNAFKFGVRQNGVVHQDENALNCLNQLVWPDRPWAENIPIIPPKPVQFIAPGVDNPHYLAQYVAWKAAFELAKATYLVALRTEYPSAQFVLMAYNIRVGWFVVPDANSDGQWMGFVRRTILWTDKTKIIKSMLRLK